MLDLHSTHLTSKEQSHFQIDEMCFLLFFFGSMYLHDLKFLIKVKDNLA